MGYIQVSILKSQMLSLKENSSPNDDNVMTVTILIDFIKTLYLLIMWFLQ